MGENRHVVAFADSVRGYFLPPAPYHPIDEPAGPPPARLPAFRSAINLMDVIGHEMRESTISRRLGLAVPPNGADSGSARQMMKMARFLHRQGKAECSRLVIHCDSADAGYPLLGRIADPAAIT